MTKEGKTKVINLTQYILEKYWKKDYEPLLEYVDDNIMWIGSLDEEYMHGRKEMQERIEKNCDDMVLVSLKNQEYEVVSDDADSCIVVGRYTACTDPDSGVLLCEKQRVTFVWKKKNELFKIMHIHLSNILHIQDRDENFPIRAGKEAYLYMQMMMKEKNEGKRINVKSCDGITWFLKYSEIRYMEAERNYSIIYCTEKKNAIKVRKNLSDFEKELAPDFLRVSRGILVNPNYIQKIEDGKIFLYDRKEITIPDKKVAVIKKRLQEG